MSHHLFSASSLSIRFHSLLTKASCSCSNVFSRSIFSRLNWKTKDKAECGRKRNLEVEMHSQAFRIVYKNTVSQIQDLSSEFVF